MKEDWEIEFNSPTFCVFEFASEVKSFLTQPNQHFVFAIEQVVRPS